MRNAFYLLTILCLFYGCVNDTLDSLPRKATTTGTSSSTTSTSSSSGSQSTSSSGTTTTATTTTVSFAHDIKPILVKYNCAGCHGSSYQSYSRISSLAISGQLYGMMSWSPGYRAMPPNRKPTSLELKSISDWISQGAHNN